MGNTFDQFDAPAATAAPTQAPANPFDQFDVQQGATKGSFEDYVNHLYSSRGLTKYQPPTNLALGFVGAGPGSIHSMSPELMNALRASSSLPGAFGGVAGLAKEAAMDLPAAAAEHLGFPGAGWLTRAAMSFAKPSIDAAVEKILPSAAAANPWLPVAYLAARGEGANPSFLTRGLLGYGLERPSGAQGRQ